MFAADINNGSSSADVITEEESADALIQAIQAKKASEPSSMFVSGWEEDEQDIVDKVGLFFSCLISVTIFMFRT